MKEKTLVASAAARAALLTTLVCAVLDPAGAGVVTLSGNLGDAGNRALVAPDLGSAAFADEWAIANNVALYTVHVAVAGIVTVASAGYASGGLDPYFSLFAGNDPATATFLDSNVAQAFSTGGDFLLSDPLAAGDYMLALGVFANMSFAENSGAGTLSDGFIGLGGPGFLGNGSYSLRIDSPDGGGGPVPEAPTLPLAMLALAAAGAATPRRRR